MLKQNNNKFACVTNVLKTCSQMFSKYFYLFPEISANSILYKLYMVFFPLTALCYSPESPLISSLCIRLCGKSDLYLRVYPRTLLQAKRYFHGLLSSENPRTTSESAGKY